MNNGKFPELKEIDTTELEKAIKSLNKCIESLRAAQYVMEQLPPEFDPNEPSDYESKTHGY